MIHSTGVLETMPRADLEAIYAFCAGSGAPPLPEHPRHAVAVLLRLIATQRQPPPEQPPARIGERLVLPYRGFHRPIGARTLAYAVRRAADRSDGVPRTAGEVAALLGVSLWHVVSSLKFLNRHCGLGVEEDPVDYTLTVKDGPL